MVYIFLADGFEEIELVSTVDTIRRADIDVKMVSISNCKAVRGAHGISVNADCVYKDCDFKSAEMLVLPGGMPGTSNLAEHYQLSRLLQSHNKDRKPIAAICAAPSILGHLLILRGHTATCYPGFEDKLVDASLSEMPVVVSDNIITARGPGSAIPFALAIIKKLKPEFDIKALRQQMIVEN